MGFFDVLLQRGLEKKAESWGKGCVRVMVLAFLVEKNRYKGIAPTYAWLARKVLFTRNHWHQVSETDFVFDRTEQVLSISDDMNLKQVIHYVIEIEYGAELDEHVPWKREELLALAHRAADEALQAS